MLNFIFAKKNIVMFRAVIILYLCTQLAKVSGMEKENMTEQNLTGYPSIDRPWLKYYSEEALNAPLPEGSMYDYMTACNVGRMDETALNYFGRKISHRQLQTEIDRCARALVASGVKPGDVVSLCMLAIPEMIYLLYAINKIGAVSNMVVLNTSEQEMAQQLSNGGKLVITVDVAAKAVAAAAKEAGVDRIVVIPVHTSMPFFVRTAASLKAPAAPSGVTSWANFIRQGQENPLAVCPGNTKAPAVIEYTGGTTGETKGAVISNRAANAVVFQYKTATTILHFAAGQRFLDVLPPFIAFGVFLGAHMPLCVGFENVVVPDPTPESFLHSYIKFRPNHFSASPLHIEALVKSKTVQKMDMSPTITVSYGGDKAGIEWEDRINAFLKAHGVPYPLSKGYGLTEVASAFCVSSHELAEMIPFARNNIRILDVDTGTDLGYGQEGEICISGPSLMDGYFRNEEATSEKIWEENGVRWLHTGDLGLITEDGFFTVTGRLKRVFWRLGPDNQVLRIYPMSVEQVLDKYPGVGHSAVIGLQNSIDGYRPIAYIIPIAGADTITEDELLSFCHQQLPPAAVPCEVRFTEKFPLTRSGKVDYRALERMAAEPDCTRKQRIMAK